VIHFIFIFLCCFCNNIRVIKWKIKQACSTNGSDTNFIENLKNSWKLRHGSLLRQNPLSVWCTLELIARQTLESQATGVTFMCFYSIYIYIYIYIYVCVCVCVCGVFPSESSSITLSNSPLPHAVILPLLVYLTWLSSIPLYARMCGDVRCTFRIFRIGENMNCFIFFKDKC
jgi:hypothetical protein